MDVEFQVYRLPLGPARSYDDPETFRNRAVLVVGGRSSGVDIARELKKKVKRLYAACLKA